MGNCCSERKPLLDRPINNACNNQKIFYGSSIQKTKREAGYSLIFDLRLSNMMKGEKYPFLEDETYNTQETLYYVRFMSTLNRYQIQFKDVKSTNPVTGKTIVYYRAYLDYNKVNK